MFTILENHIETLETIVSKGKDISNILELITEELESFVEDEKLSEETQSEMLSCLEDIESEYDIDSESQVIKNSIDKMKEILIDLE